MPERHTALFESADDFQQTCPRCAGPLSDRTAVEQDQGMLFFRVRFTCRACGYWLCTRLENFSLLGPVPRKGEPTPVYLSQADLRIRHDLTLIVVRRLMPGGVESYEAGSVWLSGEKTVTKTGSRFSVGGLHLYLAGLAQRYIRQGDEALGTRALELAAEALRSADEADPSLSDSDPENHRKVALMLAYLARLYWEQGRQEEAHALASEARTWAPELFESEEARE